MNVDIIKADNNDDLQICSDLRKKVFGDEEQAPEGLYIIDKLDKLDTTRNYLLRVDNIPVATVRFIKIDNTTIKLQRLVVLNEYRRKGYANQILNYLEKDAYGLGYRKIVMDSALKAVPFYEKNGYITDSHVFYEDNRPHVKMHKDL